MGVPPHGLTLNLLNPIMTTKPSSMTLGILASILAALLFTLMDVSAKAVSYLGTGELTFVRGLVGLFFLPLIAKRESLPLFPGRTDCSFIRAASLAGWASCSFSSVSRG